MFSQLCSLQVNTTSYLTPGNEQILYCNNQQTICLVTTATPHLKTLLQHVNIHNHWLRKESQAHNINFSYIQTKSQLADGQTKPLPCQRHKNWVSLVHFISFPTKKQAITVRHSSWFPTCGSAGIKRLYTLYISYIGDTTNLYTEQKQSRSHMLLRTLISKVNQHRNGR
jgi:hypothetical protein